MQYLKNIFLLIGIVFYVQQIGVAQKNTFRITPIKVLNEKLNISYERFLSSDVSLVADVQFWFIKDKEVWRPTKISSTEEPVLDSNNGTRFSLEIRKYVNVLNKNSNEINIYFGSGGFTGAHEISMIRNSFSYEEGTFWSSLVFVPQIEGDVDLISYGGHINTGIQFALGEVIKFEFGLVTGKAWVNRMDDYLLLSNYGFYILEEDRVRYKQDFSKRINGIFFEPILNIGFSF